MFHFFGLTIKTSMSDVKATLCLTFGYARHQKYNMKPIVKLRGLSYTIVI